MIRLLGLGIGLGFGRGLGLGGLAGDIDVFKNVVPARLVLRFGMIPKGSLRAASERSIR